MSTSLISTLIQSPGICKYLLAIGAICESDVMNASCDVIMTSVLCPVTCCDGDYILDLISMGEGPSIDPLLCRMKDFSSSVRMGSPLGREDHPLIDLPRGPARAFYKYCMTMYSLIPPIKRYRRSLEDKYAEVKKQCYISAAADGILNPIIVMSISLRDVPLMANHSRKVDLASLLILFAFVQKEHFSKIEIERLERVKREIVFKGFENYITHQVNEGIRGKPPLVPPIEFTENEAVLRLSEDEVTYRGWGGDGVISSTEIRKLIMAYPSLVNISFFSWVIVPLITFPIIRISDLLVGHATPIETSAKRTYYGLSEEFIARHSFDLREILKVFHRGGVHFETFDKLMHPFNITSLTMFMNYFHLIEDIPGLRPFVYGYTDNYNRGTCHLDTPFADHSSGTVEVINEALKTLNEHGHMPQEKLDSLLDREHRINMQADERRFYGFHTFTHKGKEVKRKIAYDRWDMDTAIALLISQDKP